MGGGWFSVRSFLPAQCRSGAFQAISLCVNLPKRAIDSSEDCAHARFYLLTFTCAEHSLLLEIVCEAERHEDQALRISPLTLGHCQ
jgi:hypothetical protein